MVEALRSGGYREIGSTLQDHREAACPRSTISQLRITAVSIAIPRCGTNSRASETGKNQDLTHIHMTHIHKRNYQTCGTATLLTLGYSPTQPS